MKSVRSKLLSEGLPAMETGPREKLIELLDSFRTAMLVTTGEGGNLRARPMALLKVDASGDLWFMTSVTSSMIREIGAHPRVTATFQRENAFATVEGRAAVTQDQAKIDELWTEHAKVYFPQGKEDPNITLIRLVAEEGEYWDNEGFQGIKYIFEAVKAYMSRTRPEEHREQHAEVHLNEAPPLAGNEARAPAAR
jgi:general stress protein 26